MSNIVYILLYGVIGALITFGIFVVGLSLLENFHFGHALGINLDAYHTLLLASLLSNWETHTCILILEEKEYPTLTSLMFGETMVNDAVVIALFNSIHDLHDKLKLLTDVHMTEFLSTLTQLLQVGPISILLGLGIAFLMCFILRRMRNLLADNAYLQMTLVLVSGYLSFMISEILHYAGALTIFCAGFVLSYYAHHSMTEKGQTLTKVTVHFLGFLPESFIFAYIGFHVPFYFLQTWQEVVWLLMIIFGSFYIRAVTVYVLYLIASLLRCKIDLPSFKSTTMLILAGMIRGSIPFALAVAAASSEDSPHPHLGNNKRTQSEFVCVLLLLTIFFTTPTLGGLVKCWVSCLGLKKENEHE